MRAAAAGAMAGCASAAIGASAGAAGIGSSPGGRATSGSGPGGGSSGGIQEFRGAQSAAAGGARLCGSAHGGGEGSRAAGERAMAAAAADPPAARLSPSAIHKVVALIEGIAQGAGPYPVPAYSETGDGAASPPLPEESKYGAAEALMGFHKGAQALPAAPVEAGEEAPGGPSPAKKAGKRGRAAARCARAHPRIRV